MGSAAVPSNPTFPRRMGPSTTSIITSATALRLGNFLHRRLRLSCLLRSSFKNICLYARPPAFKLESFDLLHGSQNFLATTCLSFSLFNGDGNRNNSRETGKSPGHFVFNDRKWTNLLLAINILAYIAQVGTEGKLLSWGAKINRLIDKGEIWRLITSSFLHANLGHLLVNCYSLNSVGPVIEKTSGSKRYIAVYMISAAASSTFSYWFSKAPAIGASGAIFGLVGSYAVYVLRHRGILKGTEGKLKYIAQVIAINMTIGLLSQGIDNWGHLGGLVGGAAASWLLGPAWKLESVRNDGRGVLTDKAPIFSLIKWRKP
ncbi:unnamed protein product [Cuscuta epithymum]|uniref:Peptidase S54 rhomboid domain-containing protein n=1 Tax=Cuscuta epithymum TaxID=186058 RepID=A0AAV0CNC4_9ASTE|nr:unnamed protein product [Cuscuta epithymum]